jgi:hypothetical protein
MKRDVKRSLGWDIFSLPWGSCGIQGDIPSPEKKIKEEFVEDPLRGL